MIQLSFWSEFDWCLINHFGITEFYKREENHNTSSIGFSPKNNSWFGWSHRAIYEFKIGHEITKDSILRCNGWLPEAEEYPIEQERIDKFFAVGKIAKDLNDCKMFAKRFAEAVS